MAYLGMRRGGQRMGGGSSTPRAEPLMDHHQPYPDMNVIFKGIPKMMQVADDMHRMTDYIMDLRNMTVGLVCLSMVGLVLFLILKFAQGRSSAARRKREIGRRMEILKMGSRQLQIINSISSSAINQRRQLNERLWKFMGIDDRSLGRHVSHYGTYQTHPEQWQDLRGKSSSTAIDMDKMQISTEIPHINEPIENAVREPIPRVAESRSLPNGHVHKRLEPIKLLVEDLPYADT